MTKDVQLVYGQNFGVVKDFHAMQNQEHSFDATPVGRAEGFAEANNCNADGSATKSKTSSGQGGAPSAGWNPELPWGSPCLATVMFTLTYRDENSAARGRFKAFRGDRGTYVAFSGSLEVTEGEMKGAYSLIPHPYAPGVLYNRIFVNCATPVFKFHLDSDGLLFQGMDFILNIWSKNGSDYTIYRSDGFHGTGRLRIDLQWIVHGGTPNNFLAGQAILCPPSPGAQRSGRRLKDES